MDIREIKKTEEIRVDILSRFIITVQVYNPELNVSKFSEALTRKWMTGN
jgi:hypothetical protein